MVLATRRDSSRASIGEGFGLDRINHLLEHAPATQSRFANWSERGLLRPAHLVNTCHAEATHRRSTAMANSPDEEIWRRVAPESLNSKACLSRARVMRRKYLLRVRVLRGNAFNNSDSHGPSRARSVPEIAQGPREVNKSEHRRALNNLNFYQHAPMHKRLQN